MSSKTPITDACRATNPSAIEMLCAMAQMEAALRDLVEKSKPHRNADAGLLCAWCLAKGRLEGLEEWVRTPRLRVASTTAQPAHRPLSTEPTPPEAA